MIEVKNYGTKIINLALDGTIVAVKPSQCIMLDEEVYKSYMTIFPKLRPFVESVVIEAEAQDIEEPKPAPKKPTAKKKK